MTKPLLAPYRIFVVWHQAFEQGGPYAEMIYRHFTRRNRNPMFRGLGIPVDFLILDEGNIPPLPVLQSCRRSATFLFIDSHMVISVAGASYLDALENLVASQGPDHRVIPIAVEEEKTVRNMKSRTAKRHLIPLADKEKPHEKEDFLLIKLTHAVYRTLAAESQGAAPPLRLLLSYDRSRYDAIGRRLRAYIENNFGLTTVDVHDLLPGSSFDGVEASGNAVLLVIHTDTYSSNDRHQREILVAKENDCPIVLLNSLDRGEDRLYPYLGNIPCLRSNTSHLLDKIAGGSEWTNEEKIHYLFNRIIVAVLQEALRAQYHRQFTEYWLEMLRLSEEKKRQITIRCRPPELLTLVAGAASTSIGPELIVYPDPPLGWAENDLLTMYLGERPVARSFVTPVSLVLWRPERAARPLGAMRVGVSISEHQGAHFLHVQDMTVELARYLLRSGLTLVYGGDLGYEPPGQEDFNVLRILIQLLQNYVAVHPETPKFINYSAFPYSGQIDVQVKARYHGAVEFIAVPPPDNLQIDESDFRFFLDTDNENVFYARAKSLLAMRKRMTADMDACIVMGGKLTGYDGRYPGIVEEVLLMMQAGKPLFIIGGFGGAAGAVARALEGAQPEELTEAYQAAKNDRYQAYMEFFNTRPLTDPNEKVDYQKLNGFFQQQKENRESAFGLANGLSVEQNRRLFTSTDIYEIIGLILEGLSRF